MNSRERMLTALARREPDRVPRCEFGIDLALMRRILPPGTLQGRENDGQTACIDQNLFTIGEARAIADHLALDNVSYVLRAPVFAERLRGADGRDFFGDGLIRSREDLSRVVLPDPYSDALYEEAAEFASKKGDHAACLVTRMGIFPTMLSMGMETFSLALYDDPGFVETLLDIYFDWMEVVAERVCGLDFDVFVTTDDMAHKSGTLFSPSVFRDLVLPRYQRVAPKITIPWVVHTDGNVMALVDWFVELGVAGLHPIEKGAMDIRAMKRSYGHRLCLLGNVDLNLLSIGTPQEVDAEVRELIRDVAPGGGYILTSGNSLTSYLDPNNVLMLSDANQRYGIYPINLE